MSILRILEDESVLDFPLVNTHIRLLPNTYTWKGYSSLTPVPILAGSLEIMALYWNNVKTDLFIGDDTLPPLLRSRKKRN